MEPTIQDTITGDCRSSSSTTTWVFLLVLPWDKESSMGGNCQDILGYCCCWIIYFTNISHSIYYHHCLHVFHVPHLWNNGYLPLLLRVFSSSRRNPIFSLGSFFLSRGNMFPCYLLTKYSSLHISLDSSHSLLFLFLHS